MIVVCPCGTKLRVKDFTHAHKMRCPHCKTMLGPEITRQATRNAAIVLDAAAILAQKMDANRLTPEEELLVRVFAQHERRTS